MLLYSLRVKYHEKKGESIVLKKYLEAGKIVGSRGLRGELRVEPWCDSAEFLCHFRKLYWRAGEEEVRVKTARVHKNMALLTLEGIETVEQADLLRGRILYLDRSDCKLEQGRYFIQDMLGLTVLDADDPTICYGELTDVYQTGANDVYEVTGAEGKQYLIPAIPDVIVGKEIEQGRILIRPLEGLFDED